MFDKINKLKMYGVMEICLKGNLNMFPVRLRQINTVKMTQTFD